LLDLHRVYLQLFDSNRLFMNLIHGLLSLNDNLIYFRFNYRATHYMVENGFYNFHNWFDDRAWYPLGRIVGGTVYPGLMLTSGAIHYVLNNLLHITVHIRYHY
jgi:hypothetical protein